MTEEQPRFLLTTRTSNSFIFSRGRSFLSPLNRLRFWTHFRGSNFTKLWFWKCANLRRSWWNKKNPSKPAKRRRKRKWKSQRSLPMTITFFSRNFLYWSCFHCAYNGHQWDDELWSFVSSTQFLSEKSESSNFSEKWWFGFRRLHKPTTTGAPRNDLKLPEHKSRMRLK